MSIIISSHLEVYVFFSMFTSLSFFHYFNLTQLTSALLFCRSSVVGVLQSCTVRRLLTSCHNFLFPLTHPHTAAFTLTDAHTLAHAYTQRCCSRCCYERFKLIKKKSVIFTVCEMVFICVLKSRQEWECCKKHMFIKKFNLLQGQPPHRLDPKPTFNVACMKTKELIVDFNKKEIKTHTCVHISKLRWSRSIV